LPSHRAYQSKQRYVVNLAALPASGLKMKAKKGTPSPPSPSPVKTQPLSIQGADVSPPRPNEKQPLLAMTGKPRAYTTGPDVEAGVGATPR
jgi:hypothetical protein